MNEIVPNESKFGTEPPSSEDMSRRRFFEKLSLALGGFCAALLGVPLVGFVIAPLFRKAPNEWLSLGKIADFEIGRTVNVTITDPSSLPWAGISAKSAAWLRRVGEEQFIAFSAHCTHMSELKVWPSTSSRSYPVRARKLLLAKMIGLFGFFASANSIGIRVVSAATTNGPRSFRKRSTSASAAFWSSDLFFISDIRAALFSRLGSELHT